MGQALSRAPRIAGRRAQPLQESVHCGKDPAKDAGDAHANQTRQNEAVVNDEAANTGCAGTVKLNRRQIAWVGRQNIVAITCRRRGHDIRRIDADSQRDGNNRRQRRRLGVNKLGDQQQNDGVGSRILFDHFAQHALNFRHMRAEHGFRHPGDPVYRDNRNHTGTKNFVF